MHRIASHAELLPYMYVHKVYLLTCSYHIEFYACHSYGHVNTTLYGLGDFAELSVTIILTMYHLHRLKCNLQIRIPCREFCLHEGQPRRVL